MASKKSIQSAERVSGADPSDNFVFQRSILAYHQAAEFVSGSVLEIGTGSGYGVSIISPMSETFTTIDKYESAVDFKAYPNTTFRRMTVPPLAGFADNSFDFVISFQVIEHIKNDALLVEEIYRVLKPGGKLIITTPNRKMSLTRNPWHVREYTPSEFGVLLRRKFRKIEEFGVFGNNNVMEYYDRNRRSVARIAKYDVLRFQKWLPRPLLRIPYDILNRMNRKKLLKNNKSLTSGIKMSDYFLSAVGDNCFDLFYIAEK